MIKRTITYAATKGLFLLSAFCFLLSSCQQEEEFIPQEQEIRVAFTTDAIQTRVNTLGTGDQWETGDRIRLLRWMNDQHVNYFYTAEVANDGAVTWTPDKKLYWDGKDAHTLVASYPNMNLLFQNFQISSEQNTLSGLKEADCMNAMWKGTPTTEPINLTLKHRLSMVTVTYTLAEEFESTVEITPEVYSYTQYVLFDIHTLERKDVTWEEGHDIWVKAYKHEEVDADGNVVAKKFTAIVSPDAYAAGDEFIRVTIGDQVLTAKMQEDITFAEGTHYTFDLKVGKDKVTLTPASTSTDFPGGWNNEEDLK